MRMSVMKIETIVVSNRYSYSENTFWGNNKSLGEIIIINNLLLLFPQVIYYFPKNLNMNM